jgi:hypothetical protein
MRGSGDAGSNSGSRERALELVRQLSNLIDHWEKYPARLSEPVTVLTRTTLADYMPWAESLFEQDHPIATLVKYLGSVGDYDQSPFPEKKRLTKDEALEYLLLLREAVRSWLDAEGGGGGSWPGPEIKPIRHRQPNSTSPISKRESTRFPW